MRTRVLIYIVSIPIIYMLFAFGLEEENKQHIDEVGTFIYNKDAVDFDVTTLQLSDSAFFETDSDWIFISSQGEFGKGANLYKLVLKLKENTTDSVREDYIMLTHKCDTVGKIKIIQRNFN